MYSHDCSVFRMKYKHLKIKLENWHLITESQPEKKINLYRSRSYLFLKNEES